MKFNVHVGVFTSNVYAICMHAMSCVCSLALVCHHTSTHNSGGWNNCYLFSLSLSVCFISITLFGKVFHFLCNKKSHSSKPWFKLYYLILEMEYSTPSCIQVHIFSFLLNRLLFAWHLYMEIKLIEAISLNVYQTNLLMASTLYVRQYQSVIWKLN